MAPKGNNYKPIAHLPRMTTKARLTARERALQNIERSAGPRPRREQFLGTENGVYYGRAVTWTVTVITLASLVAFFALSAMRLYTIGSETFGERIDHPLAMVIAGIAIVIGAETSALAFMLAAGVLAKDRNERLTLYGLAGIVTALALIGNTQIALGGNWRGMLTSNPFAVAEAVVPPIVVLGVGMVIKRIWLDDLGRRHMAERAYQDALARWHEATADPENHPRWSQFYASALREVYQSTYSSRHDLTRLALADWRLIVSRELSQEDWFEFVPAETPETSQDRLTPSHRLTVSNPGTDETSQDRLTEAGIVSGGTVHETVLDLLRRDSSLVICSSSQLAETVSGCWHSPSQSPPPTGAKKQFAEMRGTGTM